MLDISQIPSSITAHAPGYIDRDNEIIVGLQTDAPLKRAIMPNGGLRLVLNALKTYGYEPDPHVVETFTQVSQDPQRSGVRCLYRRHPELPQLAHPHRSARRLRPRPHHRRLSPRRAVRRQSADRAQAGGESRARLRTVDRRRSSATARSWPSRSARSKNCSKMAAAYGFDISGPARTAKEAVQWLYFGYLAGVKEQNGAAMSLGRTSTFLDIYFERDLASGALTEAAGAGNHRRLRHQAPHRPLPAHAGIRRSVRRRSDLGDRVDRRHGRRRPIAGHEDELPLPADALQPRPGAGTEPDDLVLAADAGRLPPIRRARWRSTPARCSSRATRSCAAPGATTARLPAACRRCSSASRCSSSAPARTWPSACCMRSTADVTRSAANRSRRCSSRSKATYLDFDDVLGKFERMMDWLAGVYVNAMNIIHYMHDKYAYERIEMALHDYAPLRTMAFGMAGMSVVADSLSAIKYAKVRVVRDETGLVTDYQTEGDIPGLRQQRQSSRPARGLGGQHVHGQAEQVPDLSERDPHPVDSDDHVERGLRQSDRQHAGRPPPRRAVRPRRQPDARPRHPRHPRRGRLGREDPLSRRRRRNLADGQPGAGRPRARRGGPHQQSDRACSMRSSAAPATT